MLQVEELLRQMAGEVHEKEREECLRYHVTKNIAGPEIVMIET
jgi:hypothetical protein